MSKDVSERQTAWRIIRNWKLENEERDEIATWKVARPHGPGDFHRAMAVWHSEKLATEIVNRLTQEEVRRILDRGFQLANEEADRRSGQ